MIDDLFYIKKFIRDDGESLELDGREILLATDNEFLVPSEVATTAVEYTEADGAERIFQRLSVAEQEITGLIIPKSTPFWDLSLQISSFFQVNHDYKIIYKQKDGGMFATAWGWISANIQISPVAHEEYAEWKVTLTIGSPNRTEYAESSSGEEIYAHNVTLHLLSDNPGGEIWDKVGLILDEIGETWEKGEGGLRVIAVSSAKTVYPVWSVKGPCTNPRLQNDTTDTEATYLGAVAEGQTLTVDFAMGTAYLDSALVTRNLSGLISLAPGDNIVGFSSDGGETNQSTLSWNNIIG